MYFQPYGDEQQLNLNWIINEIINLHKQLDPDYEAPSFTQVYPYSNLNRLNLDWILSELKALKELAPEPTPLIDIQAVAEALVALPFDSNVSYQIYDFISREGEIWRATEAIAAGGEWDSTKWFKTKIGADLAVLERWINSINNSLTSEIETRQNADNALQNTINSLSSANISDDSDAGGATVKASLNNLKGSLNTANQNLTNNFGNIATVESLDSSTTYASRNYSQYEWLIWHGFLVSATTNIAQGEELIYGTNIVSGSISSRLYKNAINKTGTITPASGFAIHEARCVQRGNVCEIHCYIDTATAFSGAKIIGEISGIALPPKPIRITSGVGSAAYNITGLAQLYLGSDGRMQVTPVGSITTILIDVVYTID